MDPEDSKDYRLICGKLLIDGPMANVPNNLSNLELSYVCGSGEFAPGHLKTVTTWSGRGS